MIPDTYVPDGTPGAPDSAQTGSEALKEGSTRALTSRSSDTSSAALEVVIPAAQVAEEVRRAAELAGNALAPNTRRAYEASWRAFEAWTRARGVRAEDASPEIVATFLAARLDAGVSVRAICRDYPALAAELRRHQPQGWAPGIRPEPIRRLLQAAHRERGTPAAGKRPLRPEHFAALADPARFDRSRWMVSARDRALLLVGFGGGLRRAELVALDVSDLELGPKGLKILIRRSKTDQAGRGARVGIWRQRGPTCPVAALETYLRGGRITEGPVFRPVHKGRLLARRLDAHAVARIVKAAVASIGLDPDEYAGHSLRVGFVTSASEHGADLESIMATTRHRSFEQVRGYIRREDPFDRNASRGLLEQGEHDGEEDG